MPRRINSEDTRAAARTRGDAARAAAAGVPTVPEEVRQNIIDPGRFEDAFGAIVGDAPPPPPPPPLGPGEARRGRPRGPRVERIVDLGGRGGRGRSGRGGCSSGRGRGGPGRGEGNAGIIRGGGKVLFLSLLTLPPLWSPRPQGFELLTWILS